MTFFRNYLTSRSERSLEAKAANFLKPQKNPLPEQEQESNALNYSVPPAEESNENEEGRVTDFLSGLFSAAKPAETEASVEENLSEEADDEPVAEAACREEAEDNCPEQQEMIMASHFFEHLEEIERTALDTAGDEKEAVPELTEGINKGVLLLSMPGGEDSSTLPFYMNLHLIPEEESENQRVQEENEPTDRPELTVKAPVPDSSDEDTDSPLSEASTQAENEEPESEEADTEEAENPKAENTEAEKAEQEEILTEVIPQPIHTEAAPLTQDVTLSTSEEAFDIEAYFNDKGFTLLSHGNDDLDPSVKALSCEIARCYPKSKQFINEIRSHLVKKVFRFEYSLVGLSYDEKAAIYYLIHLLEENTLISVLSDSGSKIYFTFNSSPKAINFINGNFLEIYARCIIEKVLKNAAELHKCDYELLTNVTISRSSKRYELDFVFRLGKTVFAGEVKSGKFDSDDYRKRGVAIGLVPDRFILLTGSKATEGTSTGLYFNDYYFSNINTFEDKLNQMIRSAMKEEN